MKKIFIYILVLTLLTQIFAGVEAAHAQLIKGAKPVPPDTLPFEPGDKVRVEITIPGVSDSLRNNADVVLVMDRTGSMSSCFDGGPVLGCVARGSMLKIDAAKDALTTFVSLTEEDFDHVGLVSYAKTGPACTPTSNCATLDFPKSSMTPANKASLTAAIGALVPSGATPIGAGMDIANQELLAAPRADAGQYMVLATDGLQNTFPGPSDDPDGDGRSILEDAIDNSIVVFTVGIGEDADEVLLKDIACQTDPDCSPVSDTSNDCDPDHTGAPSVNDLDCPDNYFFADDPAELEDVYVAIINLILGDTGYLIEEEINTDIFGNSIDEPTIEIKDQSCLVGGGSDVTPIFGPLVVGGRHILLILPPIPGGEANCLSFEAKIRSNLAAILPPGSLPGDFDIDDPSASFVPFNTIIEECRDIDENSTMGDIIPCLMEVIGNQEPIDAGSIRIENPVQPWLKTSGGDVGSWGEIKMVQEVPAGSILGPDNADYLVITEDPLIEKFTSAKDWLVSDYSPLNLHGPEWDSDIRGGGVGGLDFYRWLYYKYQSKIQQWDKPHELPDCNDPAGCFYQYKPGAPPLPDPGPIGGGQITGASYTVTPGTTTNPGPEPIVFFIPGNLHMNNLLIDPERPIIWVVGRDVRSNIVHSPMSNMICWILHVPPGPSCRFPLTFGKGFFFVNGEFVTTNPEGLTIINGGLIANKLDLRSNIGGHTDDFNFRLPSDWVQYDPAILWYFREMLGDKVTSFRELTP